MILPKLYQFISVTVFYATYHNIFIHGKASIYDAKSYVCLNIKNILKNFHFFFSLFSMFIHMPQKYHQYN